MEKPVDHECVALAARMEYAHHSVTTILRETNQPWKLADYEWRGRIAVRCGECVCLRHSSSHPSDRVSRLYLRWWLATIVYDDVRCILQDITFGFNVPHRAHIRRQRELHANHTLRWGCVPNSVSMVTNILALIRTAYKYALTSRTTYKLNQLLLIVWIDGRSAREEACECACVCCWLFPNLRVCGMYISLSILQPSVVDGKIGVTSVVRWL